MWYSPELTEGLADVGYRIVRMSRELFEQMFVEGYTLPTAEGMRLRVTKGLPEGVNLDAVSMHLMFTTDGIALRFSHPDWPDPAPGEQIPEMQVEFTMEPLPAPFHETIFAPVLNEAETKAIRDEFVAKYGGRNRSGARLEVMSNMPRELDFTPGYSVLLRPPHSLTVEQINALTIAQADALLGIRRPDADPDAPHVVGG